MDSADRLILFESITLLTNKKVRSKLKNIIFYAWSIKEFLFCQKSVQSLSLLISTTDLNLLLKIEKQTSISKTRWTYTRSIWISRIFFFEIEDPFLKNNFLMSYLSKTLKNSIFSTFQIAIKFLKDCEVIRPQTKNPLLLTSFCKKIKSNFFSRHQVALES